MQVGVGGNEVYFGHIFKFQWLPVFLKAFGVKSENQKEFFDFTHF